MNRYLDTEDYLAVGEKLEYGQNIRLNHNVPDCHGSSKSLRIERKEDGSIHARCYRCGRWGVHKPFTLKSIKTRTEDIEDTESTGHRLSEHTKVSERTQQFDELNRSGIRELKDWTPKARLWITQYGITQEEIIKHGIFYSPTLRRVILPVYRDDGIISSYQTRRIYDTDMGPKYLSNVITPTVHFLPNSINQTTAIALVEDTISGIICSRYIDTLVLHSTNLTTDALKFLLHANYKEHIIFLDDDGTIVKLNALKIKNLISKFSYARIVNSGGKDPKAHTDTELQEILL